MTSLFKSSTLALCRSKPSSRLITPALLARPSRSYSAPASPAQGEALKRTPLYEFHTKHAGKMVPFAGWEMPVGYGDVGQIDAHNHVRTEAGLFDVSHMIQHIFTGQGAAAFLASLCPISIDGLKPGTSSLSVLLNEEGGIIDDLIITRQKAQDSFYVVTNAGRAKEDLDWISQKLQKWQQDGKPAVEWKTLDGYGLVALQGPKSAEVLQKLMDTDVANFKFGDADYVNVAGVRCHIARGGYTGEDGFEISIPPESVLQVTSAIADHPAVALTGLGARDSLRIEAGMCLYGHEIDETVSPPEAGLTWVIGKDRRKAADFPGASRILNEIANKPTRRRVGLVIQGSPAREGVEIYDSTGQTPIGMVTSGIPSPTLGKNIAMGYVKNGFHTSDTDVQVKVRNRMRQAKIQKMPFVPAKYVK